MLFHTQDPAYSLLNGQLCTVLGSVVDTCPEDGAVGMLLVSFPAAPWVKPFNVYADELVAV